jgi:RHS repeat-associated protein
MKERSWQSDKYRYGFNGKEKDKDFGDEVEDFGARLLNKKISRWMAVDPLAGKYPSLSPYNFVANNPLNAIDPDGKKILIVGSRQYVMAVMAMLDIIRKSGDLGNEIVTQLMTSEKIHAINPFSSKTLNGGDIDKYFKNLANDGIMSSDLASDLSIGGANVISHAAMIRSATEYNDRSDSRTGSGSDMYINIGVWFNKTTDGLEFEFYVRFLHELAHMFQNEEGSMGEFNGHIHKTTPHGDTDELAANDFAERLRTDIESFALSNNAPQRPNTMGTSSYLIGIAFSNNPSDVVLNKGNPISFSVLFNSSPSSNGYGWGNSTCYQNLEKFTGTLLNGTLRRLPPNQQQKRQITHINNWINTRYITISPNDIVVEYNPNK